MPIGGNDPIASRAPGARNMDAGVLLIGLGAILLLVSLFLEWYEPNAEAWDVFEVWDLVLAALAVGALVAVAGRLGFGPPRPASWLIGAALAVLVIVLFALIDPPPVADAIGGQGGGFGDPGTGLWLALAAAILMTAGTLLSVARISVAFSAAPAHPAATTTPGGSTPGSRSATFADPAGSNPAVPQPPDIAADPSYGEAAGGRGGRRILRGNPSADPEPSDTRGVPPTQPTRRL